MKKQVSTVHALLGVVITLLISTSISFAQLPSYVPTDGLVGYWPFNGNAEDASGNGNHGVVNGALLTTDRNANENSAYHFNGLSDFISVTPEYGNQNFTVSFWMNYNELRSYDGQVGAEVISSLINDIGYPNNWNFGFWIFSENAGLGNGAEGTPVLQLNRNVWHNITIVFNSLKSTISLYKNGDLQTETKFTLRKTSSRIVFGGRANTPPNLFYEGKLDDIGIWNRMLTPEEVEQLFTGKIKQPCLPSYVPTDGLVGYWPFCGNADDASGNGNHGVILGAASTYDRNGFSDAALSFNGVDNLVRVSSSNSLKTIEQNNSISISAWMNIEGYPQFIFSIINKYDQETDEGWELLYHNAFGLSFSYQAYKNFNNICFPALVLKKWYNIITTFDGVTGKYKIYLNGVLVCEGLSNNKLFDTKNGDLIFGYSPIGPDEFSQGKLDDIGIWNRALTPEEIEKLYNDSKEYSCDLSDILNPAVDYGTVTDIDGNVYPTVKIGEQEWMADNLRTTRYQNGNLIPNVTDNNEWIKLKTGAWSYYNNDSTLNCPYGKLYNWYAASHPDNVCPSGWRLPKYSELEVLTDLMLGGVGIAGGKLKSLKLWKEPNVGATNSTGFSALPGGFRSNIDGGGNFGGLENHGWWYFDNNGSPIPRNLDFANESVNPTVAFAFYNLFSNETGVSIRCIKEEDPCELIGSIKPVNPRVNQGESVVFDAQLVASAGTTLLWQANTASVGWSEIHSATTAYTGLNSNKLTIKSAALGNHLQEIRLVATNGSCFDTSNVATVFITDTCLVTLIDTILTTVTDTLVIDVVLSNTTDPSGTSIKVYPNPTSSQLVIETGNASLLTGYTITITNGAGATVWTEAVSQPLYTLDLSGWGGKGLYYITLTDPQGKVITTRKIVLQ